MKTEYILGIAEALDLKSEVFDFIQEHVMCYDNIKSIGILVEDWYEQQGFYEHGEKVIALMQHLDESYADCNEYVVTGRWKVLTDSEAEEAWNTTTDDYIEECILPEMPDRHHQYYDSEKFKRDARIDGRGVLAPEDGCEYEEYVGGTYYFLYQQN